MPEGPEIRLAAHKVARVLVDNWVETVGFGLPQLMGSRNLFICPTCQPRKRTKPEREKPL